MNMNMIMGILPIYEDMKFRACSSVKKMVMIVVLVQIEFLDII